jgi:hypothetical protein
VALDHDTGEKGRADIASREATRSDRSKLVDAGLTNRRAADDAEQCSHDKIAYSVKYPKYYR